MINLFNIDIKKIRYKGANIKLIKLGDTIIYEAPTSYGVYEPYQFRDDTQLTEVEVIVNDSNDNLSYMFSGCTNLTFVNVENFNTSNVTDMSYMFADCDSLKILNLSNFDTRRVTSMNRMFHSCNSLTELNLSNFNTRRCNNVSTDQWIMPHCDNLYTIRLDNCNRETIGYILGRADISHGNQYNPPTKLGTIYCKESMVEGLTPPFGWEFSFVSEDLTELRLYNDIVDEFRGRNITEVRTIVNDTHTDLSEMFRGCANLISVNTEDWDVSNVTNMWGMFMDCTSLTSLDLSSFDTSNVYDIGMMFTNCGSLTELYLSNFDTSNVYDVDFMFSGCNNLRELHLDNCSNNTISKIITSYGFPTGAISGVTRKLYCKRANAEGLTAPKNWQFSYID